MSENYSDWSVQNLQKEIKKIEKAIKIAQARDKKSILAKMENIARQNGFELHELLSERKTPVKNAAKKRLSSKKPRTRLKVAPKYRNPDDHSQTWTGRGRKPLWVTAQLAAGATLDNLQIPDGQGS